MSFTIFSSKKAPFQAVKIRSSKSRKIDIFTKGLVNPWFWSENGHFLKFFFQSIQGSKMSFTIFQSIKTFSQPIKTRSSKSRKIDIQKGLTHAFGPKMAIFPTFFFLAIQASKMSFTIFQSEKSFSQATKTRSSKGRIIDIFARGLTHGFGRKMASLPSFFFKAMQARKMSFTIFQSEKTRFQAMKTRSSRVEILTFFQRG